MRDRGRGESAGGAGEEPEERTAGAVSLGEALPCEAGLPEVGAVEGQLRESEEVPEECAGHCEGCAAEGGEQHAGCHGDKRGPGGVALVYGCKGDPNAAAGLLEDQRAGAPQSGQSAVPDAQLRKRLAVV